MSVPPTNQVGPKVDQKHTLRTTPPVVKEKMTLGYIWKKIMELPSNFMALIFKISHAVKEAFGGSTQTASSPMPPVTVGKKDNDKAWSLDELLYGTPEAETKQTAEQPAEAKPAVAKPAKAKPAEKKEMADPLKKGGAIGPGPGISAVAGEVGIIGPEANIAGNMDKVESHVSPIMEDKAQPDVWLEIANGLVTTAKELLKTKPDTLDEYNDMTQMLNGEYQMLQVWLLDSEETSKGAQQIVRNTIAEIEQKMTELGEAILLPAEKALQDVEEKEAAELQDYLRFTKELNDVMGPLTLFASRFINAAPGVHLRVQGMIQALEQKKTSLDAEMCAQVKLHFKPNTKIKLVGNCMFESVSNQREKNTDNQGHYRKLAVDYMRAHLDDAVVGGNTYREGITDAMQTDEADSTMRSYAKRGRKKAKFVKSVDLYLNCMEKTTLYGGTNELFALSESLKAPIIVFTQNYDGKTWRYDFIAGESKYSDTPPVLLYYNGVNHYQDLISR